VRLITRVNGVLLRLGSRAGRTLAIAVTWVGAVLVAFLLAAVLLTAVAVAGVLLLIVGQQPRSPRVSDRLVDAVVRLGVPLAVLASWIAAPMIRRRATIRWALTQLSFLGIAAACLAVFATWPVRDVAPWWGFLPLGLAAASAAIGSSLWRVRDHRHRPPADVHDVPSVRDIDVGWQTLNASARLLRSPATYTHRIVHEVSPGEGFLRMQVTREMLLPASEPDDDDPTSAESHLYYIPLIYLNRGTLIDMLSTHSTDGVRVPIVSSSIARALTYKLLAYLTKEHFRDLRKRDAMQVEEALEELSAALQTDSSLPVELIPNRARRALAQLGEIESRAKKAPARARWERERRALLQLWEAAYTSYVVFAEVERPVGAPLSVSVSYTLALEENRLADEGDDGVRAAIKNHVRRTFGVWPYVYRFVTEYPRATRSYHLRFEAASDQYVSHTQVRRRPLAGETRDSRAYLIVGRTDDSSTLHYAHIYVRPLADVTDAGEIRVRVGVRERPPGLLGLVALVAVLQLLLTVVILAWHRPIFEAATSAEVATLLLATPGILSAWLAGQIAPGRLQRMPLTAVVGIAFNGASAVAAVVLAVLAAVGVDWGPITVGALSVSAPAWVLLVFASTCMTGNLVMRWAQTTYIFVNRFRRGPAVERYAI
jgi:hypothetical protein